MSATRRSLLTIMGLAGAGAAVVAPEALAKSDRDDITGTGLDGTVPPIATLAGKQDLVADALERLAAAIRAHEVSVVAANIATRLGGDEWLHQDLTLSMEVLGRRDQS